MAKAITNAPLTAADFDRQLTAGRQAYEQKRAAGLYASSVRYDRLRRRFVLELSSGYSVGVPIAALPDLAGATAAELTKVEISPAGMALHVPARDADYSVPGLVMSMTAGVIGHLGGRAKSDAKSAAAKVNGAKGGRPRILRQGPTLKPVAVPAPARTMKVAAKRLHNRSH